VRRGVSSLDGISGGDAIALDVYVDQRTVVRDEHYPWMPAFGVSDDRELLTGQRCRFE
jgi:hypothetical protein